MYFSHWALVPPKIWYILSLLGTSLWKWRRCVFCPPARRSTWIVEVSDAITCTMWNAHVFAQMRKRPKITREIEFAHVCVLNFWIRCCARVCLSYLLSNAYFEWKQTSFVDGLVYCSMLHKHIVLSTTCSNLVRLSFVFKLANGIMLWFGFLYWKRRHVSN